MNHVVYDWRELHQEEQPKLSDGYVAIMALRPGVWLVKGSGDYANPVTNGEGTKEDWKRAWYALDEDNNALRYERLRLRNALRALLNCPHIAERDPHPWSEPETETAVSQAWDVLEGEP